MMNNRMKNSNQKLKGFVILALGFLFCNYCNAQIVYIPVTNITETTEAYIDSIEKNLDEEKNFNPLNKETTLKITAYKFANANGVYAIQDATIYTLIEELNDYFKVTYLTFEIESIEEVPDYNYGIINDVNEELFVLHSKPNTINLYFVDIPGTQTDAYSGFTYYPDQPDRNYIFHNLNYTYDHYLTNLMGSYFGLLPTHDTLGGSENVYDINCEESGDFICDTYADPNLKGLVLEDCTYTGQAQDSQGAYYIPTVANYMNFGRDECKCEFTREQIQRIRYTYFKYRNYLR